MVTHARPDECLTEDELLELARGGLGEAPAAEAHVAGCATCSALLAAAVRTAPVRAWGELAGTTLGPYRIEAQIGTGGLGAVYRAWDARLGRAIALKVLHEQSPAQTERLAIEARAAAAIDHRAIVRVIDVGDADGLHYLAMELVEGESLRSVLAGGGVGVTRARALLAELADGLAAAHARGVVHRDLKPENLILARDGLRILDFGLAKRADATPLDLTDPGTVLGTAGYMAPEQARGEPADARADLFAAGAIGYELATGRRAFPGATHADRLSATLRDTPPLDELGELAPIVGRCLAKGADDRFQSARDLAWALRAGASPATPPPRVSRRGVLIAGAGAIATGVLGYLLGRRGRGAAVDAVTGLRRLTHRTGRVYTARFLNDGTRVVYGAAWDVDPLQIFVLDLGSGESHALALPSADVLAVSARGEVVASIGPRYVDHQSIRGQLSVVTLDTDRVRPLADDIAEADFASASDQSPASALAVVRAADSGFRIELPLGTPLVEEPGWITHARVSPDGRRVAYLRHPGTDDDEGALMIADVATRATRVLAGGWSSIAGLAWDPDGDAIWFTASRDDLGNVIRRASLDGEVVDVPGPLVSRLRIHDLAADRRALVTSDVWRARAMVGDRERSLSDISNVSDLSADGTQVLIGELGGLEATNGAYLVPFAGGEALRLGPGFPLAISPSGQLVAVAVDEADHLLVYSTRSADAPAITTPGLVLVARWIDERSLIGLCADRLWRLSLDGAPVALTDTGGVIALDPPRRRCAYIDRAGVLHVLDLASGSVREVPGQFPRTEVCGWLADPDAIVVRSTTTPLVLERIDATSGARTPHLVVQPPRVGLKAVDTFVLHADGKRYAYNYGEELSQLLVMNLRR